MAVWADFLRVGWISGLGFGALGRLGTGLSARKLAIQLLNLGHQVRVESSDLDTGFSQAELTAPADRVIGVEDADHHSADTPLDDSLGASDLRWAARRARL
jgi:hypothetical protein